ncbi:unnamed protein product, partial [Chrysoparadoxa australica]
MLQTFLCMICLAATAVKAFVSHPTPSPSLLRRHLNRIMLEPEELKLGPNQELHVKLKPTDRRTKHIRDILKVEDGDELRAGVINAGSCDDALVQWDKEGALLLNFREDHQILQAGESSRPGVDLILCLPRPSQLGCVAWLSFLFFSVHHCWLLTSLSSSHPATPERMLPVVSMMGVATLVLTGAAKVDKGYFGSHLLRFPLQRRAKLTEGLEQSGATRMPEVRVCRSLKRFLKQQADSLYPPHQCLRVAAHPARANTTPTAFGDLTIPMVLLSCSPPPCCRSSCALFYSPMRIVALQGVQRIVVAVGPEGGWEEDEELDLLREHGFQIVTLGPQVLRSDIAVISLLAIA